MCTVGQDGARQSLRKLRHIVGDLLVHPACVGQWLFGSAPSASLHSEPSVCPVVKERESAYHEYHPHPHDKGYGVREGHWFVLGHSHSSSWIPAFPYFPLYACTLPSQLPALTSEKHQVEKQQHYTRLPKQLQRLR